MGGFEVGPVALPDWCRTRREMRVVADGLASVAVERERVRAALARANEWLSWVVGQQAVCGDVERLKALTWERQVVSGLKTRLELWGEVLDSR